MAKVGDTVLYRIIPTNDEAETWRPAIVLNTVDAPTDTHDLGVFGLPGDFKRRRIPGCAGHRHAEPHPGPVIVEAVVPGADVGTWKVPV